ncbi:MAG: leucine-rich repeat domain-containing protein [Firmicutes bacterium]|nr:leucine-rich repeat domain-containing protein [Bacillota bacterium]
MERVDLRQHIRPTVIGNTNGDCKEGTKSFNTEDLIYIPSLREIVDPSEVRAASAVDTALMDGARQGYYHARDGRRASYYLLRTGGSINYVHRIDTFGDAEGGRCADLHPGIRPAMSLYIPSEMTEPNAFAEFLLKLGIDVSLDHPRELPVIDYNIQPGGRQQSYFTLEFGEKDQTFVGIKLQKVLEGLYNGGKLQEGLECTGRLWTSSGQENYTQSGFVTKKNPEFEYQGQKYVRRTATKVQQGYYSDETLLLDEEPGQPRWVKVEPIKWEIRNWNDLPKSLNPNGSGKAKKIDLLSEQIIATNIPFYPNSSDHMRSFWQNSTVRGWLNGINVNNITENGNLRYTAPNGGDFSQQGSFLEESFDLTRGPTLEYTIPRGEKEICKQAFEGCVGLQKITIPSSVQKIGENAFAGTSFKYAYKHNESGDIVLANNLPQNKNEISNVVDLTNVTRGFSNFDLGHMLLAGNNLGKVAELGDKISKDRAQLPFSYIKALIENGAISNFLENTNFSFANRKSEIGKVIEGLDPLSEEADSFLNFAQALGCFSDQKMKDKNGQETMSTLAQKACGFVESMFRSEQMHLGNFQRIFESLPAGIKPDQGLVKFLSSQVDMSSASDRFKSYIEGNRITRSVNNMDLLLHLELNYSSGIATKVFTDFKKASGFRKGLDDEGLPKTFSWEEALRNFNKQVQFVGVADQNRDLADLFQGKSGTTQNVFEEASKLRQMAIARNTPNHILGKSLDERTLLDQINEISENTKSELQKSTRFVYEMLDKYDPINPIIGVLVDCCATLTENHYGRTIASATMTAPDVQNLVVRDTNTDNDDIIAKGTMYVNREKGYGVINEFDVQSNYRYNGTRGEIFKALQRGARAFAKEYDSQNPENLMTRITVGMGGNKLDTETAKLGKAFKSLDVPNDYAFLDAQGSQYILYDRGIVQGLVDKVI